jgi:hypothetical protein
MPAESLLALHAAYIFRPIVDPAKESDDHLAIAAKRTIL